MRQIDLPQFYSIDAYENTISKAIAKLKQCNDVIAIYQTGSVSDPGISDIDLMVVFRNGSECISNPLQDSSKQERYLLIHGLSGFCEKHFYEARNFLPAVTYEKLWGETIDTTAGQHEGKENEALQAQIALEYLLKMFMVLEIERFYGLTKVRSLLLEVKAVSIDLKLLKIDSGRLYELVNDLIFIRQRWFDENDAPRKLDRWYKAFFPALHDFLVSSLDKAPLYLPGDGVLEIGKNIRLKGGVELSVIHRGFVPPIYPGRFFGKRYFNLLHRLNQFEFTIPSTNLKNHVNLLAERFKFQGKCRQYNREHLPYFSPLVTGLGLQANG